MADDLVKENFITFSGGLFTEKTGFLARVAVIMGDQDYKRSAVSALFATAAVGACQSLHSGPALVGFFITTGCLSLCLSDMRRFWEATASKAELIRGMTKLADTFVINKATPEKLPNPINEDFKQSWRRFAGVVADHYAPKAAGYFGGLVLLSSLAPAVVHPLCKMGVIIGASVCFTLMRANFSDFCRWRNVEKGLWGVELIEGSDDNDRQSGPRKRKRELRSKSRNRWDFDPLPCPVTIC